VTADSLSLRLVAILFPDSSGLSRRAIFTPATTSRKWRWPTASTWMSSCRRWSSPHGRQVLRSRRLRAAGARWLSGAATCGLLAWPLERLAGIQPKTLVPPMMFNNSGNIGLPLAVLAWGEDALPAAVILFMVENTLHFSFGARLLDPDARLLTLWRVPVVFAAIAGLTVAVLKIPVWQPLVIAIKMLGDVSVPLLLFSLGVRMTDVSFREWNWRRAAPCCGRWPAC
jgi:hypothetical protein